MSLNDNNSNDKNDDYDIFIVKDMCTWNSKDNKKDCRHRRLRDSIHCQGKTVKQQNDVKVIAILHQITMRLD